MSLVCEFFLDLIIICLFLTYLICPTFLGVMQLVEFDENLVSAALQRMKKWPFASAGPAGPGRGQSPEGSKGSRGCVEKLKCKIKHLARSEWEQPSEDACSLCTVGPPVPSQGPAEDGERPQTCICTEATWS